MGGVLGQGGAKGAVLFNNFIFNFSNSNLFVLLFSCPTAGPDGVGARALKSTLMYERRREVGGGRGGGNDTGRRIIGTGTPFLPFLSSSASAKGLPLNGFSWSSPAPDIVGVATVNNTAGTLFGRNCGPGNHIAARATTVERAVLMQPVDEVVVLLGGEVPAASMMQQCGLTLVPYLVIRCSSVPKVGTVPLIDLHFTLNISLTGILLPAHIWAKKSSR